MLTFGATAPASRERRRIAKATVKRNKLKGISRLTTITALVTTVGVVALQGYLASVASPSPARVRPRYRGIVILPAEKQEDEDL